jgi:hypothetical protein
MKYIAVIVMIVLMQNCIAQKKGSIYGTWINKEDKNSIVKIDKSNFCMIYKSDTVFLGKYDRTSTSCDSNYLKGNFDKNLDFINVSDGECYEITGLTDSTLAYRHTTSGTLHVFYKARKVRR